MTGRHGLAARSIMVAAVGALTLIGGTSVGALGGDGGDEGAGEPTPPPLVAPPKADAETVLSELEGLARKSLASATKDPDNAYVPTPASKAFGPDGTAALEEGNTSVTKGELTSEIVVSAGEARAVASVTAQVCPDKQGLVSARVTVSVLDGAGKERRREVRVTGTSNDDARLVDVKVGKDADKVAKAVGQKVLRRAEQAWRNGYCVKIDVTEGQSQSVTPKKTVAISATAKQRFDGSEITSPMTSKLTDGKKKVKPSTASGSPAKFTYTAPDKRPETGSVELKSVSRRGIGIANLEYTTAGDLKLDATVGPAHVTAVKCGGPIGLWTLSETIDAGGVTGSEQITFTIEKVGAPAAVSATGNAQGPGAAADTSAIGTAVYTESPDGTSGTLTIFGGSVPIQVGTFCTNGVPTGG